MKLFKSKITIGILTIVLIITICGFVGSITKENIRNVGSYAKLESLYNKGEDNVLLEIIYMLLVPYKFGSSHFATSDDVVNVQGFGSSGLDFFQPTGSIESVGSSSSGISIPNKTNTSDGSNLTAGEDYSTTNVQVENVDEADIIKTDGNYVYSMSGFEVVITDVTDPQNPKVVSRIDSTSSSTVPEEMMIYNDKMILISKKHSGSNKNTLVEIYNITDRANPKKDKSFFIDYNYYTSRISNGKLYVISSGYMSKDEDERIVDYYEEDYEQKQIGFKNIHYFKDRPSSYMTTISSYDLDTIDVDFKVSSYITDVDNIYVSDNNIYLADEDYENPDTLLPVIGKIFGIKGIWGLVDYDYDSEKCTTILKINMKDDGEVKYKARQTIDGTAIDQFSFDEYNSNLRVALEEEKGSKVVVLNEKLKVIGETDPVEEDEHMYSSRFIGDRAYLVTYRTIDPLFVFDLSNPNNPKVMGELKIPGYSTYLHPYDENHIIGIGMQTDEKIIRNSSGKVSSVRATITGMKMALFDVSDIKNPKQVSEVEIGDACTKSAVLTNHKALLFSKERELIAIPVTSYDVDNNIEKTYYSDPEIDDLIKDYTSSLSSTYISEGYLVYNLNLEEGFKLKGVITHGVDETSKSYSYSGNLLRGIYIKDNLFTVSQNMMKVNRLDTLEQISSLEI